MVPYVREIARLCAAQLVVLHCFDLVQGYNLAGRLDATGDSERSPIPYTASGRKTPDQENEHLQTFVREQFPDISAARSWKTVTPPHHSRGCETRRHRPHHDADQRVWHIPPLLLGSVTAKVLHDASCAVFTGVHAL